MLNVEWLLFLQSKNFDHSKLKTQHFLTEGQESKGVRWMPWHQESKKDVVSCDKLRGAVSRRRSGDFRMGQPRRSNIRLPYTEQNRYTETTRGSETSQYPEEKKETSIPSVAASERGRAQTEDFGLRGCGTFNKLGKISRSGLERPIKEGNNPVGENWKQQKVSRVPRDT